MNWLVTAFEPFDGAKSNSSLLLATELEALDWKDKVRFHYPVPAAFNGAWPSAREALARYPEVDGVLALGQAASREKISLERVALNWIDAAVPDNAGEQPKERPVQPGPDVLWTPIPWKRLPMPEACEYSYSAGTFVCNALMYQLLDWAQKNGKLAGFIHIPVLSSQRERAFTKMPKLEEPVALSALKGILDFLCALEAPKPPAPALRQERPLPAAAGKNLFVSGLPFELTQEQFAKAFSACGEVASVKIILDRATGKSRGFGFVAMATAEGAKAAAAKLNGSNLGGRTLLVKEARPKEDRTGGGKPWEHKPWERRAPPDRGPENVKRLRTLHAHEPPRNWTQEKPRFGAKKPWERRPDAAGPKKPWSERKPGGFGGKKPWSKPGGFKKPGGFRPRRPS